MIQTLLSSLFCPFFFVNDTARTEFYTLSLHDALPISRVVGMSLALVLLADRCLEGFFRLLARKIAFHGGKHAGGLDRKSTRLNSSHSQISYAVSSLKKKKLSLPVYR